MLNYEETIQLLSTLWLGYGQGVLTKIPKRVLNELFLMTQPAHIQVIAGKSLSASERDSFRARLIREKLEGF